MFYSKIIIPLIDNIKVFGDRQAFCINRQYYTYSEFGRAISKIRDVLVSRDIHNKCIGLFVNDDLETYASVIALWLEDNCYVPLNKAWPKQRCMDIINQTDITILLDSSAVTSLEGVNVLNTSETNYISDSLDICFKPSGDQLAYILFTSGSTGQPKGVQISRDNIGFFMDSFWKTGIQVAENDRCLQCFDLTFDVSIVSFLAPLTRGACCYTIPEGKVKYVYASTLIEDFKLTFAIFAPSMIRYLKPYYDEIDMSSLLTCILTAEACPSSLLDDFMANANNATVYNFYGPTETTIFCTYYMIKREEINKSYNGIISIGRTLSNVEGIIVDDSLNEVPMGTKGELCISGKQVSKGYVNSLSKNKSSFFIREKCGEAIRYYRTGDLCFEDDEGDILYSGRLDYQAKIQGYRVEMGEIEYHASLFLDGCNVVAMPFENAQGFSEIALFIESKPFDIKGLDDYLRKNMPKYMLPSHYFFDSSFPLNDNGKVDKNLILRKVYGNNKENIKNN